MKQIPIVIMGTLVLGAILSEGTHGGDLALYRQTCDGGPQDGTQIVRRPSGTHAPGSAGGVRGGSGRRPLGARGSSARRPASTGS